jgi:solute carrier family 24 (sodium/potassium/calcium exchanger), member 4
MFWALAVVCEDYFVPALNILCEELNVSDDVAGESGLFIGL